MIDVKDLRIGNIVLLNDKPTLICDYLSFTNTYKYEPIKLTESILGQIGFENGNKELSNCDLWDKYWLKDFDIVKNNYYFEYNDVKIKYLHDLQNLYYYHNNKQELPININTLNI